MGSSRNASALGCSSSEDTSERSYLQTRRVNFDTLSRHMGLRSLRTVLMSTNLLRTESILARIRVELICWCLAGIPKLSGGDAEDRRR